MRRGVKWYRKLAIELLVGSAIVNAYIVHQQINKFREEVIRGLLGADDIPVHENNQETGHILEDLEIKRSCSGCYAKISKESERKIAKNKSPKTKFRCNQCQKYFCLQCFFFIYTFLE